MATKTNVCNIALRSLGAARITSIDQAAEQARILKDIYDEILLELLAAHPWNFCRKRVALVELDDAPAFGYNSAYQLPGDCIRVIIMSIDSAKFVIEGDHLLTDESTAKIKYISSVTAESSFSPGFITVLAARLAAEIALPITNSNSKAKTMFAVYQEKLKMAKSADAQEGTAEVIEENSWIDERD